MPKKLRKKVSRRTVLRRLAAKGFWAQKKIAKSDPTVYQKQRRIAFARKHLRKNVRQWHSHLQGVGDFKEFTFYPKELQSKFKRLLI